MLGKRIPLFKILGFEVGIDYSWFFLAILITWSLAESLFPARFENLDPGTYWAMGAAGALGLFASIVLHELSHSVVARHFGLRIRGITLFIFGGVAEMDSEPPSARAEFWVAIAGPLASFAIAGAMLGVTEAGRRGAWPIPVIGVLGYLGWINGLLAMFNLLPAFPLDGGRVFRAFLWSLRDDLTWATRVTSTVGSWFGIGFFGLGLLSLLSGNIIGGVWWFLIGMFLRGAARSSYQQLIIRRQLEGEPVERFMERDPVTAPAELSVRTFVDEYLYRHDFKIYPVVDGDHLVGCVSSSDVKAMPRDRWPVTSIGSLARPCSADNTVTPDTDSMRALSKMSRLGSSRLMVVTDGRLRGVVTLKDLLRLLALKVELGDE